MPRDDDLRRAYGSRLRIVIDGIPLSRDDPRVPEGLRDVIDDGTKFPAAQARPSPASGTWLTSEQTAFLLECLTPVLDDLAHTGAVLPILETRSWREDPAEIAAFIGDHGQGGRGGQGIFIELALPYAERLAALAEQVQEWETEALWAAARPATWPECPQHPGTHPLAPVAVAGRAVWRCPVSCREISVIGRLGAMPGN